ncbi:MAG: type II secretion system GspH family protein [Lachnospiraceae bacterium]|nr:type II secretion system GspH family protein [Lachnospiraceae bacterium]
MNKKLNNNRGFTLIELIIAIAVLAFLMTAISSLMTSSLISNRRTQADIVVQTTAQETYNKITDALMQAKSIYVLGYTYSGTPNFSKPGESAGGSPSYFVAGVYDEKTYAVRDVVTGELKVDATSDANKAAIVNALSLYGISADVGEVKFFHELAGQDIYIKKLIVVTSETLDIDLVPSATADGADKWNCQNAITGQLITVKKAPSGTGFSENDTVVNVFTFDEGNLYYEKRYALMTGKNDIVSDWTDSDVIRRNIFSNSLSYVTTDDEPLSGCVVNINPDKGSLAVDLYFSDKNMTYTSLGMVNVRNSYVLKAKQ